MRINVYSQELTDEVAVVTKRSNTGLIYAAVQLMLHSSDKLHHPPADDDRSAVTFWLPKSKERREKLAAAFEHMAMSRCATPSFKATVEAAVRGWARNPADRHHGTPSAPLVCFC
jgi:hypothetical protein